MLIVLYVEDFSNLSIVYGNGELELDPLIIRDHCT